MLVHDLKDHSGRYRELGVLFANRGLSLCGIDLRGHGYSEGVRDHIESVESVVTDLDILIKRVKEREKGKPVFLLGQGFGASVAGVYALEGKTPVSGRHPQRAHAAREREAGRAHGDPGLRHPAAAQPAPRPRPQQIFEGSPGGRVAAARRPRPRRQADRLHRGRAPAGQRRAAEAGHRPQRAPAGAAGDRRPARQRRGPRQGPAREGRHLRQEAADLRGAVARPVSRARPQPGHQRRDRLDRGPRRGGARSSRATEKATERRRRGSGVRGAPPLDPAAHPVGTAAMEKAPARKARS